MKQRMVPVETRFLGHRMLGAPFALRVLSPTRYRMPSSGGGKACKAWSANHYSKASCTSSSRTISDGSAARPDAWGHAGQGFEGGPVAVDERQDQEPTEYQLVTMAKTGPEHPQILGHAAGQTGQRHGPGLLGETRSVAHSRSSMPGKAWTVKEFHA